MLMEHFAKIDTKLMR